MPIGTDRRLFACANYLVQIAGSLAFLLAAGNDVPMLLLGIVLFGFGIGNATSLPPLIAQVEFVKDDVARVVPLIVAISQGTYAFAPTMFGIIREFTQRGGTLTSGAAPYLFVAAAAIQGAAIAAFMLGRVRIGERKGKVAQKHGRGKRCPQRVDAVAKGFLASGRRKAFQKQVATETWIFSRGASYSQRCCRRLSPWRGAEK
jgi:MFS family permease